MATATAFHTASLSLSHELYALLRAVDPASFRDEADSDARARLDRIVATLRGLVARPAEDVPSDGLGDRARALLASVERAGDAAAVSARARWAAFLREVHPAYEAFAAALRSASLPAPSLRPTNYARNAFHVASALTALVSTRFLPSRAWLVVITIAFAGFAWSAETLRRIDPAVNERLMRLFGRVAHAHERYRVNSSTWYATALLVLALFLPLTACAAAVTVLGLGDPAAALVGRRFGRTRLRAGRSLEGTLAFFGVAALATWAMFAGLYPSLPHLALAALAAGAAGALAELFSTRVDDNIVVPLAAAAAVAVVTAL